MNKIYYYSFKRFNAWLVFNILLVAGAVWCAAACRNVFIYPQCYVLLGCVVFSVAVWCWKYLLPHVMAYVTDEGIKIDHCNMLKWQDIKATEVKEVSCGFKKLKVLVLIPKDGIDYKYNFLQRHNCGFTPFSIPLYDVLSPADQKELTGVIKSKVK